MLPSLLWIDFVQAKTTFVVMEKSPEPIGWRFVAILWFNTCARFLHQTTTASFTVEIVKVLASFEAGHREILCRWSPEPRRFL
jgi:hypothetical protein